VDNTKKSPTVLSLCSGYGGLELGLDRVFGECTPLAHVEIEAFAIENLVAKMEAGLMVPTPVWTDIKTFNATVFRGGVDILTGGYPCQPFSAAGKRQGADDPRHLWPYIRSIIRDCQPRYCFFENVEGHITLGLSTVISDLEEDGYRTTWGIFSAEEVGAPHRRKRVFILAYREGKRVEGLPNKHINTEGWEKQTRHARCCSEGWPSRPGQDQYDWEPPRVVGNTEHNGQPATTITRGGSETSNRSESRENETSEPSGASRPNELRGLREGELGNTKSDDRGRGQQQQEETPKWTQRNYELDGASVRQIERPLGRDSDGSADRMDTTELYRSCDNRTDELRLLGNGVVPATVELAWKTLYRRLKK